MQWWLGKVIFAAFATPVVLLLGYWWIAALIATGGLLALVLVVSGARAMMRPDWPPD